MGFIIAIVGILVLVFAWRQYFKSRKKGTTFTRKYDTMMKERLNKSAKEEEEILDKD